MSQLSLSVGANQCIWQSTKLTESVTEHWFEPDFWRNQGKIKGHATGRGTTYFINHNHRELVLRHYRRGGLMGKLIADQYLFTGWRHSRALREADLLLHMATLGLPVPQPIAARVSRQGLFCRADIIIEKIANATDVHQLLLSTPLSQQQWQGIGQAIALMHQAQVYHHDLNIHNIMLDSSDKVWLIDFDKCQIQQGNKWKQANLARLLRSLHKEKDKHASYHFNLSHWQSLLAGYNSV